MIKNNYDDIYYPNNLNEILYKNVDEKMIDHIKRANKKYLNTTFGTLFGVEVTYSELFENIEKYAKALKQYGISKGDTVTMALPNIPETIYYIYACNVIGATAYPIDPRSTLNSMINCIKTSSSKLFICEFGTYYSKVVKDLDKLPIDNVVVVSPVNMFKEKRDLTTKANIAKYLYEFKEISENIKNSFRNNSKQYEQNNFINKGNNYFGNIDSEYDPEIPSLIVNTSGTTGGSIKGAMHSDRSYNIYTNQIPLITEHLVRGNTYYGYVPYFSMYGSCVGMHTALTHGIVINNIPKFNGKKSLKEILDTKSNILIGVPNLIEKLTDLCVKNGKNVDFIKQYVIGGDNVSPEKLKYENDSLMALGMQSKIIFGYGSTEALPIATTNFDERSHVPGSCGILYPGVSVKIINPDTLNELSYNNEGEVYAHTPNMMMGYLNNEKENSEVFKMIDGVKYFKTGDKGYLTENGILFITGRYKRLMKRPDGHQVSPIPIENAISSHPFVKNSSVVGIKLNNDKKSGVIPTAFVILNEKIKQSEEYNVLSDIASYTLEHISGERENALAYVIVDSLPYTINGKIDFKELESNNFDNLNYYVIDDPVTREYFNNISNVKYIKINNLTKSLKKK